MAAKARAPGCSVGMIVLIRTKEAIGGQREHAAIVTQVFDGDVINAMVMPGEGMPYPISRVPHESQSPASARWLAKA